MATSSTVSGERLRDAFLVRRLQEPDEIRQMLLPHRRYAAYALAQLEPPLSRKSQWWLAEGDGDPALVMHSRGGLGQALLTLGDEIGLYALLSLHPGPAYSFATFETGQAGVMRHFYSLSHSQPMLRLVVDRQTFAAAPPPAGETPSAALRRLSARDIGAVNRLNSSESSGVGYRAAQIEEGIYFGVFDEGMLVAMAGTHGVAASERIAVVGNVFTHPLYRGNHFARQATSAVTGALLESCDEVVLTVDPKNEPAVKAYTHLGYQETCRLIEASATRRESLGAGSLLRRLVARWRGRAYGRELVSSPARRG